MKLKILSAVVITVIVCLCTNMSSAQRNLLPEVPCPNVFQYSQLDDKVVGIITIDGVRHGKTRVIVELSQPGAYNLTYSGKLSLNFGKQKVLEYINSGRALTYRVDFPLQNVVPRVTNIDVNGIQICYGPKYRSPSTTMKLEHTLTTYPSNYESNGGLNTRNPEFNQDPNFRVSSSPQFFDSTFSQPTQNQPFINQPPIENFFKPPVFDDRSSGSLENNFKEYFPQENYPPQILQPTFAPNVQPATNQATFEYIDSVCGRENVNFNIERLNVGGSPISKSRFPWIVAVLVNLANRGYTFQCGGSLISTRTVISAAHCFYFELEPIKPQNVLISLGLHNVTQWLDANNVGVERIIQHPDYNLELINFDADFAVVRLKQSVIFTTFVRPICMWQGSSDTREIEGVSGAIVGWGSDGHRNTTIVPTLVNATIVSEITCLRSNDFFLTLTSNRTLCAGNLDGSGPCMGDSGNGLMIRKRNKWMLRGTVSAALGGPTRQCQLDEYVIFSDIAKFSEWIRSNMLL